MEYRAVWNGVELARSADTVVVEGNHYFPIESVDRALLQPSRAHTVCPWKGVASYYTVTVDGVTNRNAAWYYARPSPFARRLKGRVAFWNGVRVEPVGVAR